jgi:hypothetical protein
MISDVGRRFVQNCRAERAYHQLGTMDLRMRRDVGLDCPHHRLAFDFGSDERTNRR